MQSPIQHSLSDASQVQYFSDSLPKNTFDPHEIFKIAAYGIKADLEQLIHQGLNPNFIIHPERYPVNDMPYMPAITLMDILFIQAQRANIFIEYSPAIEKIVYFIHKGFSLLSSSDGFKKNFLYLTSNPELLKLFDNSALHLKFQLLNQNNYQLTEFKLIEYAHSEEAVNALCHLGESREHSPFLKGTAAHAEALSRIKFNTEKNSAFNESGEFYLIQALNQYDIPAFVALVGAGVDLNASKSIGLKLTVLHYLFDWIHNRSVSEIDDFISSGAETLELHLINLLIQHGAKPLKDNLGRTPLMCLNLDSNCDEYNMQMIDMYSSFEALHYGLDPKKYKENLLYLRKRSFDKEALLKQDIDHFWIVSKENI